MADSRINFDFDESPIHVGRESSNPMSVTFNKGGLDSNHFNKRFTMHYQYQGTNFQAGNESKFMEAAKKSLNLNHNPLKDAQTFIKTETSQMFQNQPNPSKKRIEQF